MSRRRLLALTAVLAVIGIGIDLAMGADPPGYAVTVGLGACIGIIVISKWVGKVWLQQPDPDAVPPEEEGAPRG